MGLRAGLDRCGKSRLTGIRSPDRPARRQHYNIKVLYVLRVWFFVFDLMLYPKVVKFLVLVKLPASTSSNKVFELRVKYELQQLFHTTERQ